MADSDRDGYPDLRDNVIRGMSLLYLANQQVRLFNAKGADIICTKFLEPVQAEFDTILNNPAYVKALHDVDSFQYQWQRLQNIGLDAWREEMVPNMPPTPPGLGYDDMLGFREAIPSATVNRVGIAKEGPAKGQLRYESRNSPWASSHLIPQRSEAIGNVFSSSATGFGSSSPNIDLDILQPRKDFGAIGSHKSSNPVRAALGRQWESTPPAESQLQQSMNAARLASRNPIVPEKSPSRDEVSERLLDFQPTDHTRSLYFGDDGFNRQHELVKRLPKPAQISNPADFDAAVHAYVIANKEALLKMVHPTQKSNQSSDSYNGNSSHAGSIRKSESPAMHYKDVSRTQSVAPPSYLNPLPVVETHSKVENAQSSHKATTSVDSTTAPGSSTWARIAAITTSPVGSTTPQNTITIALSNTKQASARRQSTARPPPTEPENLQHRVVWLANLPKAFTAHDVSSQITQGPVMSILLQHDAHESLPGLSACIIFMESQAASAFLEANHFSLTRSIFIGPSLYAGITRTTRGKIMAKEDLAKIVPVPGAPYALDHALQSMGSPGYARRRVKWSRARLFYDVSLKQFKKDVLSTVGGMHNVELFHFYNPGECTVVFASVEVAATCLAAFDAWKREKLANGNARSEKGERNDTYFDRRDRSGSDRRDRGSSAAGTAAYTADVVTQKPVGHLDGKVGRYTGIEVGFVKDFNECPARLFSQYGKDGRLKASSRMEGCEGLCEGPGV